MTLIHESVRFSLIHLCSIYSCVEAVEFDDQTPTDTETRPTLPHDSQVSPGLRVIQSHTGLAA